VRRSRKASCRAAAWRWRASLVLSKLKADNDGQRFGVEIVRKAGQRPLRQIAENSGEDGAVISGKVLDKDGQTGL
jgi:chaperonin GroEL